MFRTLAVIIFICFQGIANAKSIPVRISLDWMLNPHHAPLVIGIEKGFFKECGLSVELIGSVGSLEGCKQVGAGNIDFAMIVEPQWIIQAARGLVLKPVCTLISKPLEVFISRVPLSELKGKRIAHSSSGAGFSAAVLKEILMQQNIKLDEVELIFTRQALVASFVVGQVDAVTNIYRTLGIHDIREHTQDFYVYYLENLGIPAFAATIFVNKPDMDPEIAQKFRTALEKACEFLKNNPDESWEIFRKYKPELDTKSNTEIWKDVVALFDIKDVDIDGAHYQALRDFLKKHELI